VEKKSYALYLYTGELAESKEAAWQAVLETDEHGHACECETSITLANYPELVKMAQVPHEPGKALNRLSHLPANFSGIWWYADYPEHYAGEARFASVEKGYKLRDLQVEAFAEFIAAVKADEVLPALEQEFFDRVNKLAEH
jgi:creatinine amidohydrolase